MTRRSRYSVKSEINVVPLLDVLLVLVLIFMATVPVISQSVDVELPEANQSKTVAPSESKPVILEVSGIGQYSMIIDQNRKSNLLQTQIIELVKQQIALNEKTVFLVGGAKNVPYEEIIKAINFLKLAGVKSVGLMTQPI